MRHLLYIRILCCSNCLYKQRWILLIKAYIWGIKIQHIQTYIQGGITGKSPTDFFTFSHWQRNDQSVILMVGLFEQWETEQQQQNPEKMHNSYTLICILMSEISIWSLRKTWLSTWWQNPCWQSQKSDVPFRDYTRTASPRRCMGKPLLSSSTEAYFNHTVMTARWSVHLG